MNILKKRWHFFVQHIYQLLIVCLISVLLPACLAQLQPPQVEPSPVVGPASTPEIIIEPTQTSLPALAPFDGSALRFVEGRYKRDAYCSRIFDYHQTAYGQLTIVIADNLVETPDRQELAIQVIKHFTDLYNETPVPMSRPLSVVILSNPKVGDCYSRDHLVFVAPDELASQAFFEELLGAATGIHEYWVRVGLTALALKEQPDREALKTWYQNTSDLDMAGLFIARFQEDWATEEEREIAYISATSLVQYALEVEHIQPDRLVEQVNNLVRTRWLESLGVKRKVTYPYDGRFAGFNYSQSSDCALVVQAENMNFCLNRIPDQPYFDEISEAEFLIDYAYYGRKVLSEYVMAEAPSVNHLMDPEETINFEVMDLRDRLGYTRNNTITINQSSVYYDPLHEIVHTFEWNTYKVRSMLWLTEGFAEYLGKLLPIYPQTTKRCVFEDLSGRLIGGDTEYAEYSYWYRLDPEQFKAAKAWYLAQGGEMENEESVDPRLYTDAVAYATMFRGALDGARGTPIGVKYENLHPSLNLGEQDGLELSYTQSASFAAWLSDTYSLDRVLNVYINGSEDGLLDGKSYAELKSAWLGDLRSKGQGIDIPGEH